MRNYQYIEVLSTSRYGNDANTTHRDLRNGEEYFFPTKTDNLHQGRISVTHTPCTSKISAKCFTSALKNSFPVNSDVVSIICFKAISAGTLFFCFMLKNMN